MNSNNTRAMSSALAGAAAKSIAKPAAAASVTANPAVAEAAKRNAAATYKKAVEQTITLGTPIEQNVVSKVGRTKQSAPTMLPGGKYSTQPGSAPAGQGDVSYQYQEEEYSYATPVAAAPAPAPTAGPWSEPSSAGPADYYLPGEKAAEQQVKYSMTDSVLSAPTATTAAMVERATTLAPRPNIIVRFFTWLKSLFSSNKPAVIAGEHQSEAAKLVRRARAGDQVAMAIIAGVYDQAQRSNRKAQKSLNDILGYIKAHPVVVMSGESTFGYEEDSNAGIGVDVIAWELGE